MRGRFIFNKEELKLILENYYRGMYDTATISFRDMDYFKDCTGIQLYRNFSLNDEDSVGITEYLSEEDIIEALNSTFKNEGYVVESIYISTGNGGYGMSTYTYFQNITANLKKEKVKVKTL